MKTLKSNRIQYIILAGLICLSSFLLFYHLRTNPNWYGDEGYKLDQAWNLLHGKNQNGAIKVTFVSPSVYAPLGYLVTAFFLFFSGKDILAIRLMGAFSGLGVVIVLFLLGREVKGWVLGVFASLSFILYPQTLIHFRWGYSHNLAAFWIVLAILFFLKFYKSKKDFFFYLSCLSACAATATHYFTLGIIPLLFLLTVLVDRRKSLLAIFIPSAFLIIYSLAEIHFNREWFLFDIKNQLALYSGGVSNLSFLKKFESLLKNYFYFFTRIDPFIFFGCIGLGLFKNRKYSYFFLLSFSLLSLLVLYSRSNIPLFFYAAVIFLPLIAFGFANFIGRAYEMLYRVLTVVIVKLREISFSRVVSDIKNKQINLDEFWALPIDKICCRFAKLVSIGLISLVFISMGCVSFKGVFGKLQSKVDYWTCSSHEDAENVADYINKNVSTNDVVLCSPQMSWLFNCRVDGLLTSLLFSGETTYEVKVPYPSERYAYNISLTNAKYVVIANIDRRWTFHQPGVKDLVNQMIKETWPVTYQKGEFLVLSNPRHTKE